MDNDNDGPCRDVDTVLESAIETLLWSETIMLDPDGDNDDREDGISDGDSFDDHFGPEDLSPETIAELRTDVEGFLGLDAVREALDALGDDAPDDGQIGHDFILTRNRHGVGFWDRGYGEPGRTLTTWAKTFGTIGLTLGDDGKVYHHG